MELTGFRPFFIDIYANTYGSSEPMTAEEIDAHVEKLRSDGIIGVKLTATQSERFMAVFDDSEKWRQVGWQLMYEVGLWHTDDVIDETNRCPGHPAAVN